MHRLNLTATRRSEPSIWNDAALAWAAVPAKIAALEYAQAAGFYRSLLLLISIRFALMSRHLKFPQPRGQPEKQKANMIMKIIIICV
jgi:hypothetical protein